MYYKCRFQTGALTGKERNSEGSLGSVTPPHTAVQRPPEEGGSSVERITPAWLPREAGHLTPGSQPSPPRRLPRPPSPARKQENCQVQGIPVNLKHVAIEGPHDRQNIRGSPQFFTHCLSRLHPVTSGKGGSSGLTEIEAESNYILINK